ALRGGGGARGGTPTSGGRRPPSTREGGPTGRPGSAAFRAREPVAPSHRGWMAKRKCSAPASRALSRACTTVPLGAALSTATMTLVSLLLSRGRSDEISVSRVTPA